jgi:hypothetical protein
MTFAKRIKPRLCSRIILTSLFMAGAAPCLGQLNAIANSSVLPNGDTAAGKYPHPYLTGSFQLQSGGYAPAAWAGGVGVNVELKHLVFDSSASYAAARKVNDNTIDNHSGHQRGVDGNAFYRFNKLYAGGGASWSQLSTTNYTKQSWHPRIGVGRDWLREGFSARGQMLYVMAGDDRLNGTQGPEFSLWLPSPVADHHIFWQQTVGIYTFHETVTDPSDKLLTAEQMGSRSVTCNVSFSLIYRF